MLIVPVEILEKILSNKNLSKQARKFLEKKKKQTIKHLKQKDKFKNKYYKKSDKYLKGIIVIIPFTVGTIVSFYLLKYIIY